MSDLSAACCNPRAGATRLRLTLVFFAASLALPVGGQMKHSAARAIMGENFIAVGEVEKCFGVRLSEAERERLRDIPYSQTTLQACKSSHVLFPGIDADNEGQPLTLRRLREMFPSTGQPCFQSYPRPSEQEEKYRDRQTPELRWYLIAQELHEESRSKPYWEQKLLFKENEYRAHAVVYVYMMLLMFQARGERLFEKDVMLTGDVGSDGAPVVAGYFSSEGIYVSDWWLRENSQFGIAPALKPDFH